MPPVSNAPDGPHIVARRWTQHPDNVQRARDELRLHLLKWRVPVDVSDSAVLVLSELLTNSLRHAWDPEGRHIETRFELRRNGVRIEVHDAGEGKPELREASLDEESGRGLTLVHVLTGGQWGVSNREGAGKLVWAECLPENDKGGAAVSTPEKAKVSPKRQRPRRLHHEPEAVTYARKKAGLTKRALAGLVGISEQLMNEIESGWRGATPPNLARIAEVLNCPVVFLERKHTDTTGIRN